MYKSADRFIIERVSDGLRIWDIELEKLTGVIEGYTRIQAVAFSADGHTIFSGIADGIIIAWDFKTLKKSMNIRNSQGSRIASQSAQSTKT